MPTQNQTSAARDAAGKPSYRCNVSKGNDGIWRTFYYCPGMGFDYGSEVYYGRNEWRTESEALSAKTEWELRNR